MKIERKEIADLIRSYRKNKDIIDVETHRTLDYQVIGLTFKNSFKLPEEATCVNMFSHSANYTTRVCFGLQFKNKK